MRAMVAEQIQRDGYQNCDTQAKLEELYEDPNIPPEFGTLILMINTELEKLLRETL